MKKGEKKDIKTKRKKYLSNWKEKERHLKEKWHYVINEEKKMDRHNKEKRQKHYIINW